MGARHQPGNRRPNRRVPDDRGVAAVRSACARVPRRYLADGSRVRPNGPGRLPGVAERLGSGEDAATRIKPDVIYSTISPFAQAGFRAGRRGREELGQAVTGGQLRWGGDEEPLMPGFAMNDFGTGHYSAFAILLAL